MRGAGLGMRGGLGRGGGRVTILLPPDIWKEHTQIAAVWRCQPEGQALGVWSCERQDSHLGGTETSGEISHWTTKLEMP